MITPEQWEQIVAYWLPDVWTPGTKNVPCPPRRGAMAMKLLVAMAKQNGGQSPKIENDGDDAADAIYLTALARIPGWTPPGFKR